MRTLLILAANPKGTNDLRLNEEVKKIEQGLERAKKRDQFKLVVKLAVTDDELRRAMLDNEPEIVHFCGHGTGDGQPGKGRALVLARKVDAGGLVFEDVAGKPQAISGQALAELFKSFAEFVKCVVLNACYSEFHAKANSQYVDYVVGMKKAIGDPAAIKFAVGFYDALFAGQDFEKAFQIGCIAINLNGIPEHLTPILKKKKKAPSAAADSSSPTSGVPRTAEPLPFDPRLDDVKEAIRNKLDRIKDSKVLDKNDNLVGVLNLVSDELGRGAPVPGTSLSEHIASFLTTHCKDTDLMSLVRAFRQLFRQGKEQEAERIREIVNLMLPLCLPREVLSEAWHQLQDQETVLIRTSVTKETSAAIVVAGLHFQPAKFRKSAAGPIGEHQVPYEVDPIGDPNWRVDSALREIYVSVFHADVKEDGRKIFAMEIKESTDMIRNELKDHYRALKDLEKVPCYCVVRLAATDADRKNQARLLRDLGIPDLLFIGLESESGTVGFERYAMTCLNTMFDSEEKGKPR